MQTLDTPEDAARWLAGRVCGQLRSDSRQVMPGDGFIAWPGAVTDGRQHVGAALARGALACLVEAQGLPAFHFEGVDPQALACYAGLKAATGPIAAAYYQHPSEQIDVLAVTGTNGKTSIAWWLSQALAKVRVQGCGVIGTLGIGCPPQVQYTGLTTPDPVTLQSHLRGFIDQGLGACAIEASSIGLVEHRLDGVRIGVAIFSNFSRDHLDYHASLSEYWQAKARLFTWPGLYAAVVNIDDEKGEGLAAALDHGGLDLWTYSCERNDARLHALDLHYNAQGLRFTVAEGEQRESIQTQLIGHYNVANLLGVLGALRACGVPLQEAAQACQGLLPVPGRMEQITQAGAPLVAVDYAHTPDALDKALAALRPLARQRGGQLWCVFGCGGDRDTSKRPLMAAVAEKCADQVVVTSDNPRHEKPQAIISQILLGLSHADAVHVQADRAQAIESTLLAAAAQDVVLLAGKGHEDHQEIDGQRLPFDDRVHARAALQKRVAA